MTGSTGGFLYVPGMTGAPASSSGPTGYTGTVASVFDVSNNMPWFLNPANTFGGSTGATPSWVAGNGQVLIQKLILGGATGAVTFSNIPQVFNHLRIIVMGRLAQAGAIDVFLQIGPVNNVAITSGYDWQYLYGNGGGVGATTSSAPTSNNWWCPYLAGNTTLSPGMFVVDLPFYTLTTYNKTYSCSGGYAPQSGTALWITYTGACRSSTAAIGYVKFTVSGGPSFDAASAFCLYGVW